MREATADEGIEGLTFSDYVALYPDEHAARPEERHVVGAPRLAALLCNMDPERVRGSKHVAGVWEVDLLEATDGEQATYVGAFRRAVSLLWTGRSVASITVRSVGRATP